ncbi:MAG: CapA family protein, partial [Clostridiales bacterium]|nr:CapA family protein [Clostridiales bacterium]
MKNRVKFVGTCKNTALKISTAVICAVSIFAAGLFVLSGCSPVKIVSDALLPKTAAAQAADTFTPQGDGSAQAGIQSPAPSPTPSPSPSPSPSPTVEPTPSPLRIVAVGDIMYGRKVGKLLEQKETGYKYAFSGVGEILRTGDVVFGNLESPMTESTVSLSRDSKIILKCRPEAVNGLKDAGFNVVSIANNHMMDFYEKGLLDTVKTLDDNDILHSGGGKDIEAADKPVIMEKNGVKFGLISYSDMVTYTYKGSPNITYNAGPGKAGCMPRDLETIKKDIGSLRGQVDIIAVSLHW